MPLVCVLVPRIARNNLPDSKLHRRPPISAMRRRRRLGRCNNPLVVFVVLPAISRAKPRPDSCSRTRDHVFPGKPPPRAAVLLPSVIRVCQIAIQRSRASQSGSLPVNNR